jgi:hypothetical protein
MSPAFTSPGPVAESWRRLGLDVEDDVGDVFTHAGKAGELVQHVFDLDRRDRGTLERRQQHAAQSVAQREAESALQRLGNESRAALGVGTGLYLKAVRLLEFLPVLDVDSHGVPLGLL